MALDRGLQKRDDREAARIEAERRYLMERAGVDRAERLHAWRAWLHAKLIKDFTWPSDPAAAARLRGQCIAEIEIIARQLFDRGWLIEGKRLADLVSQCLAPIAAAQKAGKIADFYPYFRSAVRRFVPVNAEEIQHQARREGADLASQSIGHVMVGLINQLRAPSLTEVVGAHAPTVQVASKAVARGRPRKFQAAIDSTPELL
jgi:hypothetical protein